MDHTNKYLVIAFASMNVAMCHVFLQNKVKMPPPMELLSNSSNDPNPKVNSHDNNEEVECFEFDNVLILICMCILALKKFDVIQCF
jgi:hypothetical protein